MELSEETQGLGAASRSRSMLTRLLRRGRPHHFSIAAALLFLGQCGGGGCAPTPAPPGAPATTVPAGQPTLPIPGVKSSSQVLIQSTSYRGDPSPTGVGAFRLECAYSHMNNDDPIVYPGQVGKAHLHTFFGNTGTNAASTHNSLRTSGRGTCAGGIANRSAYWVPSMMNGAGQPIVPAYAFMYYKSGHRSVQPGQINNIPNGLKMLAGDMRASSAQSTEVVEWYCMNGNNTGAAGAVPNCRAGDQVVLSVTFPQCWDGKNLDSADHKSHMAYPTYGVGCPASHPVGIPVITTNVVWDVPAGGVTGWRLSSDMYATNLPGGLSAHADFMEAWDPAIRDTFTTKCVRGAFDCQVRYLGDGRVLLDPTETSP